MKGSEVSLLGDMESPDGTDLTVWLVTITKQSDPEDSLCTVLVVVEAEDWGTMGMLSAASEALHWCAHPSNRFTENPQVVRCQMIGHALKAGKPTWPRRE